MEWVSEMHKYELANEWNSVDQQNDMIGASNE